MAASQLNVEVLSPAKPLANLKAYSLSVPGTLGTMEILPGHAALISEVEHGTLLVTQADGDTKPYFVAGGYVEVFNDKVTVLADVAEEPREIDRARAEDARKRALERLEKPGGETDLQRAQRALARAMSRILFFDLYGK